MYHLRIPVSKIVVVPARKRWGTDPKMDRTLTASIAEKGLECPITVRPIGDTVYSLVDGSRRLNAVKTLGHAEINCQVV